MLDRLFEVGTDAACKFKDETLQEVSQAARLGSEEGSTIAINNAIQLLEERFELFQENVIKNTKLILIAGVIGFGLGAATVWMFKPKKK